jgi:hypothetical protein
MCHLFVISQLCYQLNNMLNDKTDHFLYIPYNSIAQQEKPNKWQTWWLGNKSLHVFYALRGTLPVLLPLHKSVASTWLMHVNTGYCLRTHQSSAFDWCAWTEYCISVVGAKRYMVCVCVCVCAKKKQLWPPHYYVHKPRMMRIFCLPR